MRNVILSMMVSLDGSIARPDGNLDWFRTDRDFEDEMLTLLGQVDVMLFGRVSYELLAEYWPTAGTASAREAPGGFSSHDRAVEFARFMNTIPKIVYSKTLTSADWGPARIVSEGIADDITAMKREPGRDIVLFAGGRLASTFVNLDLVDRYRLMIHPIVIGRGLPLLQDIAADRDLELTRTRTFASSVVLLEYARSCGAPQTNHRGHAHGHAARRSR